MIFSNYTFTTKVVLFLLLVFAIKTPYSKIQVFFVYWRFIYISQSMFENMKMILKIRGFFLPNDDFLFHSCNFIHSSGHLVHIFAFRFLFFFSFSLNSIGEVRSICVFITNPRRSTPFRMLTALFSILAIT